MTETVAGLFGGCAGVLVGYPFDTVKVKLQTQDFRNPRYSGTLDCFRKTVASDGFKGLYRGMAAPMAGVGGINAIVFGVQGHCNRLFRNPDALSSHFMAGAAAGLTQSFVCSPLELTKTRLQLQADKGGPLRYRGGMHCLQEILRQEGARGVFRGQLCTVFRETPAFATYFLSYELAARVISGCPTSADAGSGTVLMAGGLAGMCSWLVSYPMDVVKSRIQSDGAFGPTKYRGIADCIRKSVHEEGLSVFTRGLNSTMIRAFPTNAATFYVVSYTTKLLMDFDKNLDDAANSEVIRQIMQTKKKMLSEPNTIRTSYSHPQISFSKHQAERMVALKGVVARSEGTSEKESNSTFYGGEGHDIDTYEAAIEMLYAFKSTVGRKTMDLASELTFGTFTHQVLSTVI